MSTRVRTRLIRLVLCTGILGCSAAFVDAARAGLPSTPAVPAVATATQSAVATASAPVPSAPVPSAPVIAQAPTAPQPAVRDTPPVAAPSAPPAPAAPQVPPEPVQSASRAVPAVAAPVEEAVSTERSITSAVTSAVEQTTSNAAQVVHMLAAKAVAAGGPAIGTVATDASSALGVARQSAAALASRVAPSSLTSTSNPAGTSSGRSSTGPSQPTVTSSPAGSIAPAPGRPFARNAVPLARSSVRRVRPVLGTAAYRENLFANGHEVPVRGSGSPAPPPRVPWPAPIGVAAAAVGSGGGGLLLFGLLAFAFLLAIPTAVRWLRPALALGLSPAYVALSDRPG